MRANIFDRLGDVLERQFTERIHAFVGLMGIPIMRKKFRVVMDSQEVVCHPNFRLIFHTQSMATSSSSTTGTSSSVGVHWT